jgi:hypothetical protein
MSVDAGPFKAWLADLTSGDSVSAACRQADLRRATLTQQLIRGRVPESTVVALARAYGQEPLIALSGFPEYRDLTVSPTSPSDAEVLSQIAYRDVLKELLRRSDLETPPAFREEDLEPAPFPGSVRAWIEAIDPGRLRQRLADDLRMAPSNLSTQITSGTLPPLSALHAARLAGTSLGSALIVTGLITPLEGGWGVDARAVVLTHCADETLIAASINALEGLQKAMARYRKTEATDEFLGW